VFPMLCVVDFFRLRKRGSSTRLIFCFTSLYSVLFHLSILSVFFGLVCDDVSAGPRKTCGKWSGAIVFCFARLACAGCIVLILDDLMKGIPEVRYGIVFCGHGEDLFDLTV